MANDTDNSVELESITFAYSRARHHRTIHVDGAFGGVTPRGHLAVTFYSERRAFPLKITNEVRDGKLGEVLSRELEGDVLRESEVTTMLDLQTAREVHKWLGEHIATLESVADGEEAEA